MNQSLEIDIAGVMPSALATGLFVSLCTVSAPTPASGAISGTYATVSGLASIPCMDAPDQFAPQIAAEERKGNYETESKAKRHVLLNGYYPELSPATNWGDIGWRATITHTISLETAIYDIEGAEADSQAQMTRLYLCKVTT